MSKEHDNLRLQLDDAVSEAQYWKTVAVYLAQCHGGNASIVDLKSTSKYQRSRLTSIMRKCRDWLLKAAPAPSSHFHNAETVATDISKIIILLETDHPDIKEPSLMTISPQKLFDLSTRERFPSGD